MLRNLTVDQYGVIAELCMRCGMFLYPKDSGHYDVYKKIAGEIIEELHLRKYPLCGGLDEEFAKCQLYQAKNIPSLFRLPRGDDI